MFSNIQPRINKKKETLTHPPLLLLFYKNQPITTSSTIIRTKPKAKPIVLRLLC
jgi:hypothetical protein